MALDDSSEYWNNLTDFNPSTSISIPKTDQAKPLLEIKLNLTCLSATSIEFNKIRPIIDLYIATNMTQCNQEMFLFKKKLNVCDKETVKGCVARSVDVDSEGGCEFMCECEPVLDTCHMYLSQRFKPPYFSTAIDLYNIIITRIF